MGCRSASRSSGGTGTISASFRLPTPSSRRPVSVANARQSRRVAEMTPLNPTPLIRLGNLFPQREVYAKCEFLAPSGCFKIRGAMHLLEHLSREGHTRHLMVPSMGNTALGAAVAAQAFGFSMTGVVPQTIARAKDERLRALGVELI